MNLNDYKKYCKKKNQEDTFEIEIFVFCDNYFPACNGRRKSYISPLSSEI